MTTTLRLATEADIEGIVRLAAETFTELGARRNRSDSRATLAPGDPVPPARAARHAQLLATDPALQWVAEDGGELVGAACALVREGLWGLSLLVVHPRAQGAGLGRALLDRVLVDTDRGIICSSEDPAALRRYAAAGFDLLPYVELGGRLRRDALPPAGGVRDGTVTDLGVCDSVDRRVRGAAHGSDWLVALRAGARLLLADGGYALMGPGRSTPGTTSSGSYLVALAAVDEPTATSLLAAALRATDDEHVSVAFVTAAEGWAVRMCVAAGLAPSPGGAVFVRGPRFGGPYLPSGAFL